MRGGPRATAGEERAGDAGEEGGEEGRAALVAGRRGARVWEPTAGRGTCWPGGGHGARAQGGAGRGEVWARGGPGRTPPPRPRTTPRFNGAERLPGAAFGSGEARSLQRPGRAAGPASPASSAPEGAGERQAPRNGAAPFPTPTPAFERLLGTHL